MLKLFLLPAFLLSTVVWADVQLRNLPSGASFQVKEPIVIRAHDHLQRISSSATEGFDCFVRMKHSESYDRVIPRDRKLLVTDVSNGAVSGKGYVATYTTVVVASASVEGILCSSEKNARDPTMKDFSRAVGKYLSVTLPDRPVEIP